MATDRTKSVSGPFSVTVNAVAVGHTDDNALVRLQRNIKEVASYQSGLSPVSAHEGGGRAEVEIPYMEVTTDILLVLFPNGTVDGGAFKIGAANFNKEITPVGDIVLTPLNGPSMPIKVYDAMSIGDALEVGRAENGKWVLAAKFVGRWKDTGTMHSFNESTDTTAPTVDSTSPIDEATGISTSADIEITFDEAMNEGSVIDANSVIVIKKSDETELAITGRSYNSGTNELTLSHGGMSAEEEYLCCVTTAVKDEAGNHLAAKYLFSWTCA